MRRGNKTLTALQKLGNTQAHPRTQAQKGITATHAPRNHLPLLTFCHRVKEKAAHGREKERGHRAPWLMTEERTRGHWTEGRLSRTNLPATLPLALNAKQTAPKTETFSSLPRSKV